MSKEFQESWVEANGLRLHCMSAGQGPLMLFLHGFPEFWYAWKELLREFGRDHLAVAPDMRGYNLSDKPVAVEQYRSRHLVEDIRALAAHFAPGRLFTLVAHDWGGAVAWAFAIRYPQLLERLIIINAPHPAVFARLLTHDPAQQRASAYMHMFRSAEAEARLSADGFATLLNRVMGDGLASGSFSAEDRAAYVQAWSVPGALTGGLNYYRANEFVAPQAGSSPPPAPDPAAWRVTVPTLVIWGEADKALLPQNLDGLQEFVPDLTIKRVPGASHWIIHEQPRLIEDCIRAFCSARPAPATS